MQVFFPLANWNLSVLSLACSALCFLFSFCHRKLILNCQARQLTQESIRSLIVFIYFIVGALSLSLDISLLLLLLLSTAIRVVFPKVLLLLLLCWPGQCDYEAVCIDCFGSALRFHSVTAAQSAWHCALAFISIRVGFLFIYFEFIMCWQLRKVEGRGRRCLSVN